VHKKVSVVTKFQIQWMLRCRQLSARDSDDRVERTLLFAQVMSAELHICWCFKLYEFFHTCSFHRNIAIRGKAGFLVITFTSFRWICEWNF